MDDPAPWPRRRGVVPQARDRGGSKSFFTFFLFIFSMAQAVESKCWAHRKEQLLHYRMIGLIPDEYHKHKPTKRVCPDIVVGNRWLLKSLGHVAAFPIIID